MEVHLEDLRRQIRAKESQLEALETGQRESWATWDGLQRELSEVQIKRERATLNDLRAQLNQVIVSYNEAQMVAKMSLPFGRRYFNQERSEELLKKLAVPLTHEDVSTRQAGGRQEVVYIETFKALEKAQEVFGFDFSVEVKSEPSVLFQQNGKVVMKAIVRVTLANGSYHEDVGIGVSFMNDMVEAVRMASKACVSDSIKRALQHFGPALGSCLKDKEWVTSDLTPAVHAHRSSGSKTPKWNDEGHGINKRAKQGMAPPIMTQHVQHQQMQASRSSSSSTHAPTSGTVPSFNPPPQPTAQSSSNLTDAIVSQQPGTNALNHHSISNMPKNYMDTVAAQQPTTTNPNYLSIQAMPENAKQQMVTDNLKHQSMPTKQEVSSVTSMNHMVLSVTQIGKQNTDPNPQPYHNTNNGQPLNGNSADHVQGATSRYTTSYNIVSAQQEAEVSFNEEDMAKAYDEAMRAFEYSYYTNTN